MPSSLSSTAPSCCLLRFLRAQCRSLAVADVHSPTLTATTTTTTTSCLCPRHVRSRLHRSDRTALVPAAACRPFSTSAARCDASSVHGGPLRSAVLAGLGSLLARRRRAIAIALRRRRLEYFEQGVQSVPVGRSDERASRDGGTAVETETETGTGTGTGTEAGTRARARAGVGAKAGATTRQKCAPSDGTLAADDAATTWQVNLWGPGVRQGVRELQQGDVPSRSDEDDVWSVSKFGKAEPIMRCTEIDEHAQFTSVDALFKKTEVISKYGLNPRDLRKIDSSNLPHILVRPAAILLNLIDVKVLIKHDRVLLLLGPLGSQMTKSQADFARELRTKLGQNSAAAGGGLPFEFRALEVVLTWVTSRLESDFRRVRYPAEAVLKQLETDIDRDKLRELLILSKQISALEQRAKLVTDAIEELLEADDDLAAMYLTEKANKVARGEDDHTEVEMLLESYHKLADGVTQGAGALVVDIRNTEDIIRAILDANRNSLMLLDLKFSVGTLGLATGTFIAGLYGMNLTNYMEHSSIGFGAVTGVAVVLSFVVCSYGLVKLRRVQQLKMVRRFGGGGPHHHPPPSMPMPMPMRPSISAETEAEMATAAATAAAMPGMGVSGIGGMHALRALGHGGWMTMPDARRGEGKKTEREKPRKGKKGQAAR